MGTETVVEALTEPTKTMLVKLNNPLMGTETSDQYVNAVEGEPVKLNNPLMGTETLLRCNNACISASSLG